MARPSRLSLAKNDILPLFSGAPGKIYSQKQLADILRDHRDSWGLAASTKVPDFIAFLTKHGNLRAQRFHSKHYGQEIGRYSWGEVSPLALALSIKSRSYLCHATAVSLHNLAPLNPKKIFVNAEQSPKPSASGTLTQDGIKLAFSRKQRQSNLVYAYAGISVTLIAGKNTNRLGVEQLDHQGSKLSITNLERTLIDIVVRPAYADGIAQVLKAYIAARDRISIDRLIEILKKLDYVYPYHQSIGFLMQMADYPDNNYEQLRKLGFQHDFYLAHDMQNPAYSESWRLFFPRALHGKVKNALPV